VAGQGGDPAAQGIPIFHNTHLFSAQYRPAHWYNMRDGCNHNYFNMAQLRLQLFFLFRENEGKIIVKSYGGPAQSGRV